MIDFIDDSAFSLGMPTQLETYKHQCVLLEAELSGIEEVDGVMYSQAWWCRMA